MVGLVGCGLANGAGPGRRVTNGHFGGGDDMKRGRAGYSRSR
jgi:hypothetical protein